MMKDGQAGGLGSVWEIGKKEKVSLHSVADNIQWNGCVLIIIIIGYRQVAFCHSAVAALSVRFDITETH